MIVEGVECKTFDNMGFNHSIGMYARSVRLKDGTEKVAVKYPRGAWRFWTPQDRLSGGRRVIATGQ